MFEIQILNNMNHNMNWSILNPYSKLNMNEINIKTISQKSIFRKRFFKKYKKSEKHSIKPL